MARNQGRKLSIANTRKRVMKLYGQLQELERDIQSHLNASAMPRHSTEFIDAIVRVHTAVAAMGAAADRLVTPTKVVP